MEQHQLYDDKKGTSGVGCLRGAIVAIMAPAVGMFIGIWIGKNHGAFNGVMSGIAVFFCVLFLAVLISFFKARLTIFDCVSPVIISIFPAILFWPIHMLEADFFSPVTCMGSGFLLSLGLFLYRAGRLEKWGLIWPALCFLYECLPINLPTSIDDLLAVGGSVCLLFVTYSAGKLVKKPPVQLLDG